MSAFIMLILEAKMNNVVDINKNTPAIVSEIICIKCCRRWICVRPEGTPLKNIECPDCGQGAVIETGQPLE